MKSLLVALCLSACSSCAHAPPTFKFDASPDTPGERFASDVLRTEYMSSVRITVICPDMGVRWGTGTAINASQVLTAKHVIDCEGSRPLVVTAEVRNGAVLLLAVMRAAPHDVDVALLETMLPSDRFTVWVNLADDIRTGEELCIVAGDGPRAYGVRKCGAVSWTTGDIALISMHIVPGNSGGGVFNAKGELVAVATRGRWDPRGEFEALVVRLAAFKAIL